MDNPQPGKTSPTAEDLSTIRKASILVLAVLIYPRIVTATAQTKTETSTSNWMDSAVIDGMPGSEGKTVHQRKDDIAQVDPNGPAVAFTAAEMFVAEAEKNGYDVATLMTLFAELNP